jgi:hypothetical protein
MMSPMISARPEDHGDGRCVSGSFGFLVSMHDQRHCVRMKAVRTFYLSAAIFAAKLIRRCYVFVDGALIDSAAFARHFAHSPNMAPPDAWR